MKLGYEAINEKGYIPNRNLNLTGLHETISFTPG